MAKLTTLRLDSDKSLSGIWVDYGLGIRFRIARWGSPRVQSYLGEMQSQRRADLIDPKSARARKVGEEMVRRTLAFRVLTGWENIEDDAGEPIPFSGEKAYEILSDPAYEEIADFVTRVAHDAEAFRVQIESEDLGN